jgi:transcriptional regulator with XRE-family HTH domain
VAKLKRTTRSDDIPPEKALGQVIRRLREDAGWSQEEFAERADISRYYVYILETGTKAPTLTTLTAVAACFDLKPSELLSQAGI